MARKTLRSLCTCFCALLALSSVALAATGVRFDSPAEYLVRVGPQSLASGDFNGDGYADVVVVTSGAGYMADQTVTILLNNGNGTFAESHVYTLPDGPTDVIVADFNGDGKPDLAVSDFTSSYTAILLGNGDGTFGSPINVPNLGGFLTAADLNADGKQDLIVAEYYFSSVSVLLGNGDGTFGEPTAYSVSANPVSVAVGDFNNDRAPDLAVATEATNTISILSGDGMGHFGPQVVFPATTSPSSIVTGDFDGNGTLDLAVGDGGASDFAVLMGLGNGTFGPPRFYAAESSIDGLVLADVNGDGKLDVLAENGAVLVYLGNADGTFHEVTDLNVSVSNVVVADFNHDGKQDLAAVGSYSVAVMLGNGQGDFQHVHSEAIGAAVPLSFVSADFTGDGQPDLAVTDFNTNSVYVLAGTGIGTFQQIGNYPVGNDPVFIGAADINGDGILDLITANIGGCCNSTISILYGTGGGNYGAQSKYVVGRHPYYLAFGDVNGDGNTDIALAYEPGSPLSILLGNGDGTFQPIINLSLPDGVGCVALADMNHDGKLDLIAAGTRVVDVLIGNGDGTFQPTVGYPIYNEQVVDIVIGDFNGDSYPDVAVLHSDGTDVIDESAGPMISVLLNAGDGSLRAPATYGKAVAPSHMVMGDWNGDGKLDIAAADAGVNGVSILTGNGDGSFTEGETSMAGSDPNWILAGKFTADGKVSLVTLDTNAGTVSLLENTKQTAGVP